MTKIPAIAEFYRRRIRPRYSARLHCHVFREVQIGVLVDGEDGRECFLARWFTRRRNLAIRHLVQTLIRSRWTFWWGRYECRVAGQREPVHESIDENQNAHVGFGAIATRGAGS